MLKKYFAISCVLILSSCASMFSGTVRMVNVETDTGEPVEAIIKVDGNRKSVTLPDVFDFDAGDGDIVITVKESKNHYKSTNIIKEEIDPMYWINYFNFFIATPVDMITGAMWGYNEDFVVYLNKK